MVLTLCIICDVAIFKFPHWGTIKGNILSYANQVIRFKVMTDEINHNLLHIYCEGATVDNTDSIKCDSEIIYFA